MSIRELQVYIHMYVVRRAVLEVSVCRRKSGSPHTLCVCACMRQVVYVGQLVSHIVIQL